MKGDVEVRQETEAVRGRGVRDSINGIPTGTAVVGTVAALPRRERENGPFLIVTEFDRFPQDLDAFLAPLLVAVQDPDRADHAADEPAFLVFAVVRQPLLAQLGEQLLQLPNGGLGVSGEVRREGLDGARVECGRERREQGLCGSDVGRGQGEVRPRSVDREDGRGRRELLVGSKASSVRAYAGQTPGATRADPRWGGSCQQRGRNARRRGPGLEGADLAGRASRCKTRPNPSSPVHGDAFGVCAAHTADVREFRRPTRVPLAAPPLRHSGTACITPSQARNA